MYPGCSGPVRELCAVLAAALPLFHVAFTRKRRPKMKTNTKKIALAGVLCAVAVVGSMFSFPVFGSKCAPVQHMVNVLCAVLLGPWYGVAVAFVASLLRNLLGLGSLMAFPGSMCGALLCGILYHKTKNLLATLAGEVFGTGIIGGLLAWPVAVFLMGKAAGDIAFYSYIVPFLVSTVGGSIIAGVVLIALEKNSTLKKMQASLAR
ncbi:MAG: energy coupling factor transporter S component ThiW [Oscillospiraceae bacterium]|nr:energy coupling factor transporter S component ThiW [Oscillospiraceae bacterium]